MKNIVRKERWEFFNIFNMFRKRKFKGYTGLAVKNSSYRLITLLISKVGSLVFTIILARLLMPELFGLYSLTLSTLLLFISLTDLGIGRTLIRFVSKALSRNNKKKAKAHLTYLLKIKIFLTLIASFVLLITAKTIASNYYKKPLFLGLLIGIIYVVVMTFIGFIEVIFQSVNNFKQPLKKEIYFQIIRVILVPLVLLFFLRYSFSNEVNVFILFSVLSFSELLILFLMTFLAKKNVEYLSSSKQELSSKEKKITKKFIVPLAATTISSIFFIYVDIIILGRFVSAGIIGNYQAAFSLIGSAVPFLSFSTVLFPIFSSLRGKRLERALSKSIKISLILSILSIIGVIILAPLIVLIIYGKQYVYAVNILRVFSLLFFCVPLITLYNSYLISKAKTKIIASLTIISATMNIILNYFLITWLLNYGEFQAALGAASATILSRYFYLLFIFIYSKSKKFSSLTKK